MKLEAAVAPGWTWLKAFQPQPVPEVQRPLPRQSQPEVELPRWSDLEGWFADKEEFTGRRLARLRREFWIWQETLQRLGGDPSWIEWDVLRVLRTSREEDWSDWLGTLLATSRSGSFAAELGLRRRSPSLRALPPVVEREAILRRAGRRADLVAHWRKESAHIEVKIGDRQFEKTYDTCRAVEGEEPNRRWSHWILLPEEDVEAWRECERERSRTVCVRSVTWREVAIALRRTLLRKVEPGPWEAWAWTYCGAVEQKLLGMPLRWDEAGMREASSNWLALLREARRGRDE